MRLPVNSPALVAVTMLALAALLPAQDPPPSISEAEAKAWRDQQALDKKYGPQLKPNAWFPVADIDLGAFTTAQDAVGRFEFTNPRDEAIQWRGLKGSCTCGKAVIRVGGRTYELTSKPRPNELVRVTKVGDREQRERVEGIEIGAREKGEVEVHLAIPEAPGPRQAMLDVHTSDAALPQFKLRWRGKRVRMYVVSPERVTLDQVTWGETREFAVQVTSPVRPDFNITGMKGGDAGFEARWNKKLENGRATWTINGSYTPGGADAVGRTNLEFTTDAREHPSFSVLVLARVASPLTIEPGTFLPLGMVRRGKETSKAVTLAAKDGTRLTATKLSFDNLTIAEEFLQATSRHDGNKLVVELVVSARAPRGLLKGELLIDLDHPVATQQRVLFNGFVR